MTFRVGLVFSNLTTPTPSLSSEICCSLTGEARLRGRTGPAFDLDLAEDREGLDENWSRVVCRLEPLMDLTGFFGMADAGCKLDSHIVTVC